MTSNNKAPVEIGSRFKIKGDTTAGDLAALRKENRLCKERDTGGDKMKGR